MKKFALTALAAAIATIGLASAASADSRYDDDEWRHRGQHDGGDWDGRRDGDRHARRDRDHDDWRWRHHRPRFAYRHHYRDVYCFVKKVRRYDDWGNVYIKKVRICD